MSERNRLFVNILVKKTRNHIIDETVKHINHLFETRIKDMELFARIFYASILSSYVRARTFSTKVGMILPELEAITKALYAMSSKRASKQGSFDTSKAFEVSNALKIRYRIPLGIQNDKITYKITFTINHPALIYLEKGIVSWEGMEKSKIKKILQASLSTLKTKNLNKKVSDPIEKEILKAIGQLNKGGFKIIKNKRPYMEIAVKNLIRQKDFINILIK